MTDQINATNGHPRRNHWVVQGKGGVGKSFVATLIAEHLMRRGVGDEVVCIDTDPFNSTLASYPALKADRLDLLEDEEIVGEKFDKLIERIVTEDKHFVIDTGANSFLPLSRYLRVMAAQDVIAEAGKKVVVHSVIVGGDMMLDTLHGFASVAETLPPTSHLVVWLNEFQGPVVTAEGKPFEEMKVYKEHIHRITAVVRLAEEKDRMFRNTLRALRERRLLFLEGAKHAEFDLMAKQRITQMAKRIFPQLEAVI
jgi:hypothetical protein